MHTCSIQQPEDRLPAPGSSRQYLEPCFTLRCSDMMSERQSPKNSDDQCRKNPWLGVNRLRGLRELSSLGLCLSDPGPSKALKRALMTDT